MWTKKLHDGKIVVEILTFGTKIGLRMNEVVFRIYAINLLK